MGLYFVVPPLGWGGVWAKGNAMKTFSERQLVQLNKVLLGIHSESGENLLLNACRRLREGESLIECTYSMALFSSNLGHKIETFNHKSIDMDERSVREYAQYYEKLDFCVWYSSQPSRAVYRSSDIITKQKLEESNLYREWMRPLGVYYSLFASCFADGIKYGEVAFMRSHESGDFTDEEVFVLSLVNDHLSQRFSQLYPTGIERASFNSNLSSFQVRYRLTKRELEIVNYLKQGMERQSIASRLCITNNTLKKHVSNIYKKMGVNSETKFFAVLGEYLD